MEGAVSVEAIDARCDETSDGHEVAADDQEGMGDRGARDLRPPLGVVAAKLGASAVGDALKMPDLRVEERTAGVHMGAGTQPSLRRASAGETTGYRRVWARKASIKSQPALAARTFDDVARFNTGCGGRLA